jgi:HD superfamily phosphohydrolase YqeK
MREEDLRYMKVWFSEYTGSFYADNKEDRKNISLKIEHTHNVCLNMIEIAKSLALDDNRARRAEAVALFHDIGRFPQYAEYKTFRDADSKNHGLLGMKTLVRENVLQALPENEQTLILNTVKFHNAYAIPSGQSDEEILFLKMIRDADKIDVFRVFNEYFESPREERASATAFGVPDTPEYSRKMLSCLVKKKIAAYSDIRTENDFKIMLLSWVYDLHFTVTLQLMQNKNYINRIMNKLPRTDEIQSAMIILREYVQERLNSG